jgi:hypothetical protein
MRTTSWNRIGFSDEIARSIRFFIDGGVIAKGGIGQRVSFINSRAIPEPKSFSALFAPSLQEGETAAFFRGEAVLYSSQDLKLRLSGLDRFPTALNLYEAQYRSSRHLQYSPLLVSFFLSALYLYDFLDPENALMRACQPSTRGLLTTFPHNPYPTPVYEFEPNRYLPMASALPKLRSFLPKCPDPSLYLRVERVTTFTPNEILDRPIGWLDKIHLCEGYPRFTTRPWKEGYLRALNIQFVGDLIHCWEEFGKSVGGKNQAVVKTVLQKTGLSPKAAYPEWKKPEPAQLLNHRIQYLDLPEAEEEDLRRAGINTVGTLISQTPEQIAALWKNNRLVKNLQFQLEQAGLSLRG